MKKSFMTRVLATGLSVAMAFSLSTATNLVSAQAASKPVLVDYVTGGSGKTMTVNVGETAKIKVNAATKKNYKIASVKKSSGKIKVAKNKAGTVVTVRGVEATPEGKTAAIKVSFTAKKTGKTSKYTFASKVTVVAPKPAVAELTEVTQKEARKFAATLSTTVEKVEVADFSIVRKADNAVIPVKSATLDAAKTGVTIETFVDLADGKEYTFTYTAKDEAKTASSKDLTVTAGKIEKLDLTTTNVTAGTADDGVKVVTKDANGVVLNTYSFSDAAGKYINVTVTPTTAGYRDGNKIFLPEVGNTATVKVEYHTYKYVDGKEEGALTETFTVTAVADATVMNNFVYTVKTSDGKEPSWSSASFKENHQISIGDSKQVVYFKFKDSKGNDKTAGYKVSSSDGRVLIMAAKQLTGSNDPIAVAGANEGTAYIVVKNSKDELVTTLPVTVAAKKVATTLELSTQAVSISNAQITPAVTKDVTLVVKDQFGNKINLASPNPSATTKVAISALSGPTGFDAKSDAMNKAAVKSLAGVAVGTGSYTNISGTGTDTKLTITGSQFKQKGTYVYKIDVTVGDKTVSNSLTVNVSEPNASGTESYTIQLSTDSIDLVANNDNKSAKRVEIKVAKLKDGVISEFLKTNSITSISVKSSDGSSTLDVVSAGATTCGAVISTGSGASGDPIVKKAKKDTTYLVKISLQGGKDLTASFTTKDSQLAIAAQVVKTDAGSADIIKNVLAYTTSNKNDANVKYACDNSDFYIQSGDIKKVNGTWVNKATTIRVDSIDVNADINGDGSFYVQVNIPINAEFTTTASNGWSAPNP